MHTLNFQIKWLIIFPQTLFIVKSLIDNERSSRDTANLTCRTIVSSQAEVPEPSGVVYNGSRYGESGIGHQQSGAILRPRHVANTMPLSVQQARDAGRECVCVSLAKTIAHHRRSREPAGIPLYFTVQVVTWSTCLNDLHALILHIRITSIM